MLCSHKMNRERRTDQKEGREGRAEEERERLPPPQLKYKKYRYPPPHAMMPHPSMFYGYPPPFMGPAMGLYGGMRPSAGGRPKFKNKSLVIQNQEPPKAPAE